MSALDKYLPEKIRKINSDDQAWITHKLKILDRKRKRVFRKERRSGRWRKLNKMFKEEVKAAKSLFYKNIVADLKTKSPSQWYSSL